MTENIIDLVQRRVRSRLETCLEQIQSCGWSVVVVEDHTDWLVVSCFDPDDRVGSESIPRMIIDPFDRVSSAIRRAERAARESTR